MKLYKFKYMKDKQWITVIPTIEVHVDDLVYAEKNIAIVLSIFIWHFKWLFLEEVAL